MNLPQTLSPPAVREDSLCAIAPAWHTIVVLVVLFGLSAAGAASHGLPSTTHPNVRATTYIFIMVYEWVIVAFIAWGMRRRNVRVRDIVGGNWGRPINFLLDLGIAIAFLVIAQIVLGILSHFLKASANQAIRNLLPRGAVEVVLFLFLAMTAGFCEELIFRGYLQRQFSALTHAFTGGIVMQGILFGASHGYQGWKLMLVIAVFGTMFGSLVHWRGSLRPGMLAHFIQDGVGGLVGSHFMR